MEEGLALATISSGALAVAARDARPPSFVQEQPEAVVRHRDWIPAAFVL